MTATTTTTTSVAADATRLRNEIARHEAACGCELGSVFTFAALALFVGRLAVHDSGWSPVGTFGRGVLWVVGCSLVGKLLGLAWARLRLIQLRAQFHRIPTTQGPVSALGKD